MTDVTAPLNELRAAYRAYQNAKRDKKEQITEKYRRQMDDEVRKAVEAEKFAFAKLLKDRKDFYDLKVTDIQDHVLRTRNWKMWEDIRDFAEIEPEQVVRSNARAEKVLANSPFRWSQDKALLTVLKNSAGKDLAEAVLFDMTTNKMISGLWWPNSGTPAENDISQAERAAKAGDPGFLKFVSAEIQRALDAGEIQA